MPSLIYHIADANQWEQAQSSQFYVHPSLHSEGFIHCSSKGQLEETANLYFSGDDQILVLFIDETKLQSELKYEPSSRGEDFPHIYGPVNINAVVKTKVFRRRGKKFKLPITD